MTKPIRIRILIETKMAVVIVSELGVDVMGISRACATVIKVLG